MPAPTERAGALWLLLLAFPATFLPIDLIYAAGGVLAYASAEQAARIYLYALALAFLASATACLACLALGARRGTFAALWLALTLAAFAVGHGMLIWSSYYIDYNPALRWLRMLLLLALCAAIAWRMARRRDPQHLATVASAVRGSAMLMLVGGIAALVVVAVQGSAVQGSNASGAPAAIAQPAKRPSIFLVSVDALSAAHMSAYGYARPTTPRLEQFAGGATAFLHNYASSNFTTGSVSSLLLGYRPWAHRVLQLEGRPPAELLPDSLPARLAQAGYVNAAVTTNSWASPEHLGMADQFAVLSPHRICLAANPLHAMPTELQTAIQDSLVWNELAWLVLRLSDELGTCKRGEFDPELAFAEGRRILAAVPAGRPLFLWIHLFAPHDPYLAPAPFVGLFNPGPERRDRLSTIPPNLFEAADDPDFPGALRDRYDESVRLVDHHIGAFLDELKREGRYDDAVIVVTADHGESFTKGYGQHGGPMLHDEVVRVPLFIKTPGQHAPRQVRAPTELVDLKATLLALAGVEGGARGEGVSLVPLLQGKPLDHPVFSMNFQQSTRAGALANGSVAMVDAHWKYVCHFGAIHYPRMPPLADALYDLAQDPWETNNLASTLPDRAARMRAAIEARLRRQQGGE